MSKSIPAWVDMARLCEEICASDTTVISWATKGVLPPARLRGGKLMWKWSEVDQWLTVGPPDGQAPGDKAREIRDATRRAAQERSTSH